MNNKEQLALDILDKLRQRDNSIINSYANGGSLSQIESSTIHKQKYTRSLPAVRYDDGGDTKLKWSDLSITDKAPWIRFLVSKGITSAKGMENAYNKYVDDGELEIRNYVKKLWPATLNIEYDLKEYPGFLLDKTWWGGLPIGTIETIDPVGSSLLFRPTEEEYQILSGILLALHPDFNRVDYRPYGIGGTSFAPIDGINWVQTDRPGIGTVAYDPTTNDAESIKLDLLHLMRLDPKYALLYDQYMTTAINNRDFLFHDFGEFDDAREFINAYLDGRLRPDSPEAAEAWGMIQAQLDGYLRDQFASPIGYNTREQMNYATTPMDLSQWPIIQLEVNAIRDYLEDNPQVPLRRQFEKAEGGPLMDYISSRTSNLFGDGSDLLDTENTPMFPTKDQIDLDKLWLVDFLNSYRKEPFMSGTYKEDSDNGYQYAIDFDDSFFRSEAEREFTANNVAPIPGFSEEELKGRQAYIELDKANPGEYTDSRTDEDYNLLYLDIIDPERHDLYDKALAEYDRLKKAYVNAAVEEAYKLSKAQRWDMGILAILDAKIINPYDPTTYDTEDPILSAPFSKGNGKLMPLISHLLDSMDGAVGLQLPGSQYVGLKPKEDPIFNSNIVRHELNHLGLDFWGHRNDNLDSMNYYLRWVELNSRSRELYSDLERDLGENYPREITEDVYNDLMKGIVGGKQIYRPVYGTTYYDDLTSGENKMDIEEWSKLKDNPLSKNLLHNDGYEREIDEVNYDAINHKYGGNLFANAGDLENPDGLNTGVGIYQDTFDPWFGKGKGYNFFDKLFKTDRYKRRKDLYNLIYQEWTADKNFTLGANGEITYDPNHSDTSKSLADMWGVDSDPKKRKKYFRDNVVPLYNDVLNTLDFLGSYYKSKGYAARPNYGTEEHPWDNTDRLEGGLRFNVSADMTGNGVYQTVTDIDDQGNKVKYGNITIGLPLQVENERFAAYYGDDLYSDPASTFGHEYGHYGDANLSGASWLYDKDKRALSSSGIRVSEDGMPINYNVLFSRRNDPRIVYDMDYINGRARRDLESYYDDTWGDFDTFEDYAKARPDAGYVYDPTGKPEEMPADVPEYIENLGDWEWYKSDYAKAKSRWELSKPKNKEEWISANLLESVDDILQNIIGHDYNNHENYADYIDLLALLLREGIYDARKVDRHGRPIELTEKMWNKFMNTPSYLKSRLAKMYDFNIIRNMVKYIRADGGDLNNYQEGQEYNLSLDLINNLIEQGYQIAYV